MTGYRKRNFLGIITYKGVLLTDDVYRYIPGKLLEKETELSTERFSFRHNRPAENSKNPLHRQDCCK